jgi:polysaccharide pyruvyl transferase WcaK-like protein
MRATRLTHFIVHDLINLTISGNVKFIIIQFSPSSYSILGQNILLNILFSYKISLCSSLKVRDQVSHTYNTTSKITVLYIFILIFSSIWGRTEWE